MHNEIGSRKYIFRGLSLAIAPVCKLYTFFGCLSIVLSKQVSKLILCNVSSTSLKVSLFFRFNGHFPDGPELADRPYQNDIVSTLHVIGVKGDGGGGDNWSYKTCKAPVKSYHHQQANTQLFTGRMPFLSPNQQCQSTEVFWRCKTCCRLHYKLLVDLSISVLIMCCG